MARKPADAEQPVRPTADRARWLVPFVVAVSVLVAACSGSSTALTAPSTTSVAAVEPSVATQDEATSTSIDAAEGTEDTERDVPAAVSTSMLPSTVPTEDEQAEDEWQVAAVDRPIVGMYVPYWDVVSARQAVEDGSAVITDVSMFAYRIAPDGGVVLHDPRNGQVDQAWVEELRAEGKRVFATITNDLPEPERWSPAVVHQVVADPARMQRHVDELVNLAVEGGFDGIEIDYEALDPADRTAFASFLAVLSDALHARGRLLAVDIQAFDKDLDTDAYDRASIAAVVDQFRLMTYTYSWEGSAPGPIAPLPWVDQVLETVLAEVPAANVLLGVAGFGIDWPADGAGGSVTWSEAQDRLAPGGVLWSEVEAERTGTYDGHEIWFSDGETARIRADRARVNNLPGIFIWGAPGAAPDFWIGVQSGLAG